MAKKTAPLLPATDELLRHFGERLRLARLRRRIPAKQIAERAGMSPMTLRSLERGGSGVTVGAYLAVMQVLGIEKDLDFLGKSDPVGRELQDAQLPTPTKGARPALTSAAAPTPTVRPTAPASTPSTEMNEKELPPSDDARDWIEEGGFSSAEALAGLIVSSASTPKKAG